jgi:hypothetical membrane protein
MLKMLTSQQKENWGRRSCNFVLLVGLTLMLCGVAPANQNHHLGLSVGLANFQSRDQLVSPLIYSGEQRPLALSYLYKGV